MGQRRLSCYIQGLIGFKIGGKGICKDTDGNLTGIYVEMWKTWAKAEGYQLAFVQGDGYGIVHRFGIEMNATSLSVGGWNAGPNGWAGVLGLIANGTVNATLDKYSYRPGRYSAFRSSLPVLYSKVHTISRLPSLIYLPSAGYILRCSFH